MVKTIYKFEISYNVGVYCFTFSKYCKSGNARMEFNFVNLAF